MEKIKESMSVCLQTQRKILDTLKSRALKLTNFSLGVLLGPGRVNAGSIL
jgi:hypothetical protein